MTTMMSMLLVGALIGFFGAFVAHLVTRRGSTPLRPALLVVVGAVVLFVAWLLWMVLDVGAALRGM